MADIPITMRALVKAEPGTGLWQRQVAVPEIGPNDVLIRVTKTAICGTDLHIHSWDPWAQETIRIGQIIGHEFTGVVAAVGSHVVGWQVGMRASGEGHITCGHCRNCRAGRRHLCRNTVGIGVNRDGCFADYVAIPAVNAFHVPDDISEDVASYLDPLGNAVHTALSWDLVGEDVLITGAGPIGIMAVAIARHVGARHIVVTDLSPYRLALAAKMGASRTVDVRSDSLAAAQSDLGMLEGFDIGMEMSGVESAVGDLLENMNHGGRISLLGIPSRPLEVDLGDIIFKGLQVRGIYGREMFETWYKAAAMLSSGLDVSAVLTHRFGAEEFAEAFDVLRAGECGKVVLEWA